MLDSDLLEVLVPVVLETHLFLAFLVEGVHDGAQTVLEPGLELQVVFVTRLDDRLVVSRVLNLDFARNFILLACSAGQTRSTRVVLEVLFGRCGTCHLCIIIRLVGAVHGGVLALEVNAEHGGAETWELAPWTVGKVDVHLHSEQQLDVLVLLLHNFVARQHDEALLVDEAVVKLDQAARVVHISVVEVARNILFEVQQQELRLIDGLETHFVSNTEFDLLKCRLLCVHVQWR